MLELAGLLLYLLVAAALGLTAIAVIVDEEYLMMVSAWVSRRMLKRSLRYYARLAGLDPSLVDVLEELHTSMTSLSPSDPSFS